MNEYKCDHPEEDHDTFGCTNTECYCKWGTPYGYPESNKAYSECHPEIVE